MGIADLLAYAISLRTGRSVDEERARVWLVDSKGLVTAARTSEKNFAHHKLAYAHAAPAGAVDLVSLEGIVRAVRPTALIGVSAQPSTFTKPVVAAMAELNARPIIFSLSNPTSKSECTAREAYEWTGGAAVFASGSPFDALTITLPSGAQRAFSPGQGNNAFIFPAVGLAVLSVRMRVVPAHSLYVAACALAACVAGTDVDGARNGNIYPSLSDIRSVSASIAIAVAEDAYAQGIADLPRPADLAAHIRSCMWDPRY